MRFQLIKKITDSFFVGDVLFRDVFLGLLILSTVPIVVTGHLPIQDLPTHLSIIETLKNESTTDNWHSFFENRLEFKPYALSYILGVLFANFLGSDLAAKLLILLYIALFPISFLSLILIINRKAYWATLFSFLFIFSDLFLFGFINYLLSIPFTIFGIAIIVYILNTSSFSPVASFVLLFASFVIYLSHPVSLAFLFLFVLFFSPIFLKNYKRFLRVLFPLIPVVVFLSYWYLVDFTINSRFSSFPISFKLQYLSLFPFILIEGSNKLLFYIALSLVLLLFIPFFYRLFKSSISFPVFLSFLHRHVFILSTFIFLFLLYLLIPSGVGDTVWFDFRLAVFLWMFFFLFLGDYFVRGYFCKFVVVSLILINLFAVLKLHRDFDLEISPLFDVISKMEPGQRLFPFLLELDSSVIKPFYTRDKRKVGFFSLYAHFGSYYHLYKGGISPWMTFHSGQEWIPLHLKDPFYEKSFKTSDIFVWRQLFNVLPKVIDNFDYILVKGNIKKLKSFLGGSASIKYRNGIFAAFVVNKGASGFLQNKINKNPKKKGKYGPGRSY
jgi:hypothetical protein